MCTQWCVYVSVCACMRMCVHACGCTLVCVCIIIVFAMKSGKGLVCDIKCVKYVQKRMNESKVSSFVKSPVHVHEIVYS